MFQYIFDFIPPSSNSKAPKQKDVIKDKVAKSLGPMPERPLFPGTEALFARVFHSNHERVNVRDIHNVFKPLFDVLEGRIYENDRQILQFEGVRLDMERHTQFFTLDFGFSDGLKLHELTLQAKRTCFYVEIGKLPMPEPETVKVTWVAF